MLAGRRFRFSGRMKDRFAPTAASASNIPFRKQGCHVPDCPHKRANFAGFDRLAVAILAVGARAGAWCQSERSFYRTQDVGEADRLGAAGQMMAAPGARAFRRQAREARASQARPGSLPDTSGGLPRPGQIRRRWRVRSFSP